jgi:hypothetical protein
MTEENYSWFQTFAVFCMLYVFFWVIPRHLNFICRHFLTLCLFHLHRQVGAEWINLRIVWVANGGRFDSKIASANKGGWQSRGGSSYTSGSEGVTTCIAGHYPFTTCCVTEPTPTLSPSLLLALAIFEPNLPPLATQTILKFIHPASACHWR